MYSLIGLLVETHDTMDPNGISRNCWCIILKANLTNLPKFPCTQHRMSNRWQYLYIQAFPFYWYQPGIIYLWFLPWTASIWQHILFKKRLSDENDMNKTRNSITGHGIVSTTAKTDLTYSLRETINSQIYLKNICMVECTFVGVWETFMKKTLLRILDASHIWNSYARRLLCYHGDRRLSNCFICAISNRVCMEYVIVSLIL